MSQQINLLPKAVHGLNPALITLLVWGGVVLVILMAWGVNQFRLSAAREVAAASANELKQAKAKIQQRADAKAALLAEIEIMKPTAAAAQQFINLAAGLGRRDGFSAHFSTIASATEEGLWLTKMEIGASGKVVRIEGQSLGTDAVVRFSRNLNAAFSGQGVQFASLELVTQTAAPAPAPGDGRLPLSSTKFMIR